MKKLGLFVAMAMLMGCPSQWKVQGGPQECVQLCKSWGMELTGMVGVGNQDPNTHEGASACVCELPRSSGGASAAEKTNPAAGTTASLAAAVVAIQQAQQQQQQAAAIAARGGR